MKTILGAAALGVAIGCLLNARAGEPDHAKSDGPKPSQAQRMVDALTQAPDWIARPSADDVARFYPSLARSLAIGGRARIACDVSPLGMLERCAVTDVVPTGLGFGEAALSMAALFRMRPREIAGAPIAGGRVLVPIRFEPADLADADPPPPPRIAQPSARALALARRLAALQTAGAPGTDSDPAGAFERGLRQGLDGDSSTDQSDGDTREAILKLVRDRTQAHLAAIIDLQAEIYAHRFTEAELAAIVAFQDSPAGKAWQTQARDVGMDASAMTTTMWRVIVVEVRAAFCQTHTCLERATASAPAVTP